MLCSTKHVALTPNYGEKWKRCWRARKTPANHLHAAVREQLETVGFPLAGETISHYRILDGLAGGGMGLGVPGGRYQAGTHG